MDGINHSAVTHTNLVAGELATVFVARCGGGHRLVQKRAVLQCEADAGAGIKGVPRTIWGHLAEGDAGCLVLNQSCAKEGAITESGQVTLAVPALHGGHHGGSGNEDQQ